MEIMKNGETLFKWIPDNTSDRRKIENLRYKEFHKLALKVAESKARNESGAIDEVPIEQILKCAWMDDDKEEVIVFQADGRFAHRHRDRYGSSADLLGKWKKDRNSAELDYGYRFGENVKRTLYFVTDEEFFFKAPKAVGAGVLTMGSRTFRMGVPADEEDIMVIRTRELLEEPVSPQK
jgi:hypothetical protein